MFLRIALSILLSLTISGLFVLEAATPCQAVYLLGGTPKLNSGAKRIRKLDPVVWANLKAAIKTELPGVLSKGLTPSVDLRKFFGPDYKPGRVDLLVQAVEWEEDHFLVKGAVQVEVQGAIKTFDRLRVTYKYDAKTKAVSIQSFEISDYNPSLMILGKKRAAWVEGKIRELVDAARNPDGDENYPQILVERFNPHTFSPQNARAAMEVGVGMPEFRLEWISAWGADVAANGQLNYETLNTSEGVSALEGMANELQGENASQIPRIARELQEAGHLFKVYVRETTQVSWTASTRMAHFYIVWRNAEGELVGKVVKISLRSED